MNKFYLVSTGLAILLIVYLWLVYLPPLEAYPKEEYERQRGVLYIVTILLIAAAVSTALLAVWSPSTRSLEEASLTEQAHTPIN